jgi:hypothetical protein
MNLFRTPETPEEVFVKRTGHITHAYLGNNMVAVPEQL